MSKAYAQAGVDLSAGNLMSRHAAACAATSWGNSPLLKIIDHSRGNFRGPRTFLPSNLPEGTELLVGTDGIGTKTSLHAEAFTHHQAAIDLVAMLTGDATRVGAMPLVLSNLLDVSTLGKPGSDTFNSFRLLFTGLKRAAVEAGVVLLGGETAHSAQNKVLQWKMARVRLSQLKNDFAPHFFDPISSKACPEMEDTCRPQTE